MTIVRAKLLISYTIVSSFVSMIPCRGIRPVTRTFTSIELSFEFRAMRELARQIDPNYLMNYLLGDGRTITVIISSS